MKRKKVRQGFTLVELLIVLAIIGALMAIGIPIYTNALQSARATTVASNIRAIADQIRTDLMLNGKATYEGGGTYNIDGGNATSLQISRYIRLDNSSDYAAGYKESGNNFIVYVAYIGTDINHSKVVDKLQNCDETTDASDLDNDGNNDAICKMVVAKTGF